MVAFQSGIQRVNVAVAPTSAALTGVMGCVAHSLLGVGDPHSLWEQLWPQQPFSQQELWKGYKGALAVSLSYLERTGLRQLGRNLRPCFFQPSPSSCTELSGNPTNVWFLSFPFFFFFKQYFYPFLALPHTRTSSFVHWLVLQVVR